MLKNVMTKRHSKHHARLLAYLDALEEAARELGNSKTPVLEFERYETLLGEFCDFMRIEEAQHEKEEERLLLPALTRSMEEAEAGTGISVKRVFEEHTRGRHLTKRLANLLQRISQKRPVKEAGEYYLFCESLVELIWHFRKHVWAENCFILPAAERLIPDMADQFWNLSASAPAKTSVCSKNK